MRVETIAEQLLFTTARLTYKAKDGRDGSATGFFYGVWAEPSGDPDAGGDIQFLVTNRHVAEEAGDKVRVWLMRAAPSGEPALGQVASVDLNVAPDGWFFHPNPEVDVAV